MEGALRHYPRTFWIVAVAICAAGCIGPVIQGGRVPRIGLFMPSIFLIQVLCAVATCILLSMILAKSRRRELQPLVVLYLATALLDLAVLLTIRLPGRATSLILPGNAATAWLLAATHLAGSACAVVYAAWRRRKHTLELGAVRSALWIVFPAWTLLIAGGIVVLLAFTQHAPPAAERLSGFGRDLTFLAEFAAGLAALGMFVRLLRSEQPDWIDLAVLLTIEAGLAGLLITVQPGHERFGVAWLLAQLIYLCSGTFVLVAAIRDLIDRLGDRLRIESNALRLSAKGFEANALVEAELIKSRFVAMVSHELRTPLGGIIGMAELLEREPLTERQARFTSAIAASANVLLRIVNDLLDFSRAESGRIELEHNPFDLEQTVDDIVVLFREQARERGVALNAYIDPAAPRTIDGDQTRVKQVLQNLVNNAVRFTTEGSIRIEVTAAATAGVLNFAVHDTGIGIAAGALERIFDAFVQEDASTARRFGGTGLGLSIARHLVELMGGRITVRSIAGVGSTFSFTLPIRTVKTELRPASLRDLTVLIFELQTEGRALLQRYAEGWNMDAVTATSLEEAVRALRGGASGGRRFDVVLAGAGVSDADVSAFAGTALADVAIAPASSILIRDAPGSEPAVNVAGYDACILGPLRQSALFDTIVRLRSNKFAARVVPTIEGIAARAPRPERILVAEDNDVNQMLLVAQLEHLGFSPDVAADGKAAIDAASAQRYDLIFMDCQMPEIDGFEATRHIRASAYGTTPIVALTANVLPGYRETCIAAGMSDYLPKPALIKPLTSIVDRWLPAPAPAAQNNPAHTPAARAVAVERMRERLREVFHGDQARVDRVIDMSMQTLVDGSETLRSAIAERDLATATTTAHRLKGVALETGFAEIAEQARTLETALRAGAWEDALAAHAAFVDAVTGAAAADGARA